MELSIVIVSWNTRNLLRDCLRTVFDNIDDVRAQVFVVDNASSDGSAEMVAEHFPDARLIRNDTNRGFAAANNQAMQGFASGRYILLLNSDTLVLGDVLRRAINHMNAEPAIGVLGCQALNTDGTIQQTCFRDPDLRTVALIASGLHRLPRPRVLGRHVYRGWDRTSSRHVDVVTGCFMMVRRAAIEEVGLFDEQFFFYAEEADWCRRFRDAGWQVRFVPVGQIVHHGAASATQLDERRTVLLGEALVRLMRKRRGTLVAGLTWLLLWTFNASRSVIWSAAWLATRRPELKSRAALFGRAALRFNDAWPRQGRHCQKRISATTNNEVASTSRRYSKAQAHASSPPLSMIDVEKKMNADTRRRVLAVASGGGHWVQLLRLRPALASYNVTYVTVNRACQEEIGDEPFVVVPDATRWTKLRLVALVARMFFIVVRTRPQVVISTGAAPGYFAILFGKLLGARTIWIDSIANVEHLSLSGRKASRIADTTLSQWPHLAEQDAEHVAYAGAVI